MINLIIRFLLLIAVLNTVVFAVTGEVANPQIKMQGARGISIGMSPVLSDELSNAMLNPAAVSDIQKLPISLSSQSVLDTFDYLVLSTGFNKKFTYSDGKKMRPFGIGISLASSSLRGSPSVEAYNGVPYQTGTYSAGFNMLHVAGGTSFYDSFTFDKISLAGAVKYTQQYISKASGSTFGLDLGVIADYHYTNPFINGVSFGASVHNIISPVLTLSETGNESIFPINLFLGARADMLADRLSVFASHSPLGLTTGAEYELQENLFVRGSTNFSNINFGAGILLDNISTGISNYNIKCRIDLSYEQLTLKDDSNSDSFAFTVSSLGRSIPLKPQILFPDNLVTSIAESSTEVSGVGPKNTSVRVFSNGTFLQTVLTNRKGLWHIDDLPLFEGTNSIQVESYDVNKDATSFSNIVTVVSDTLPPKLDIIVYPEGNELVVQVSSDEPIASIGAEVGERQLRFKKEKIEIDVKKKEDKRVVNESVSNSEKFIARMPLPENLRVGAYTPNSMDSIKVFATDKSGNTFKSDPLVFFGSIKYPLDKHVHYNDNILAIGDSSDMLNTIYVNNNIVYIDDKNRFSIPVDLKPGKNLVKTSFETLNGKKLEFNSRVLRLVSYEDMTPKVKGRREIEFLSTLGVLHGESDNKFYPTRFVTRDYITKIIVLALDETISDSVTDDVFVDVPKNHPYAKYIQAGISTGVVFAFPDGTFRPDRPLTLSEAVYMLSNAGVIDYEEVDEEDKYVTRAELAEFLAYTAKFERRIETLIEWEVGY